MNDGLRRVLATVLLAVADVSAAAAKEVRPGRKPRRAKVAAWLDEMRDVRRTP